jgi:hypothetical protein
MTGFVEVLTPLVSSEGVIFIKIDMKAMLEETLELSNQY